MSYVAITEADLEARMSEGERLSLEDAGQEGSYKPRIPGIIAQITSLVRSKVVSCRSNIIGPAGMIPEECLYHAVTLCRNALIASLPVPEGYTDPRQSEYRDAMAFLDKVATCEVAITNPSGAAANAAGICWGSEKRLCF